MPDLRNVKVLRFSHGQGLKVWKPSIL